MIVGANLKGKPFRIGAEMLDDDQLNAQFQSHFDWLMSEQEAIIVSKFSLDMSWFRECWWEMVRRGLVKVN